MSDLMMALEKMAETCYLSSDSLHLNKVLLCFDLPTLVGCDIVIAHNGDEPPKEPYTEYK